jgi:hypothetical protein
MCVAVADAPTEAVMDAVADAPTKAHIEYIVNIGFPTRDDYPLGECQGVVTKTKNVRETSFVSIAIASHRHRDGGKPVLGCLGGEDDKKQDGLVREEEKLNYILIGWRDGCADQSPDRWRGQPFEYHDASRDGLWHALCVVNGAIVQLQVFSL